MNRRQFLGAAGLTGVAGCLNFSEDRSIEISELKIVNFDNDPHIVQVIIKEDSQILLWTTEEIPASDDSDPRQAGFKYISELPKAHRRYAVHVRVDESESRASIKSTNLHKDIDCTNIEAEISSEGEVEMLYTVGCP